MSGTKTAVATLRLNDQTLLETRAYVNGQWVEKPTTFPVLNPANGETIAHVTDMDVADTSADVSRHKRAERPVGVKLEPPPQYRAAGRANP